MMRGSMKYLLAGAALILAAPGQAGDKPLIVAAPDWVTPLAMPTAEAPGDNALMLFDRQIRMEGNRVITYIETAGRLSTPEMLAQGGTLALDWHPDKGDILVHKVALIRGGKTVDVLASGQKFSVLRRETGLERLQLNGRLTATMQIEGAQIGDVLHLAFSIVNQDPALGGFANTFQPLSLGTAKIGQTRLRAMWQNARPVAWKIGDARITAKASKVGDYSEISVTGPLPEAETQPGDAPARFRFPSGLQLSDFGSWTKVSATSAVHYKTDGLIKGDASLSAEVARIAAETTDPRARTAAALRVVQDKVRYLFNGMALGDYVPATPAETWTRKYGDCKGKTLLLLAMLRELGVAAEPVLVNVTYPGAALDMLPGFQAFDHVIVRATIDGKALWLDGTSNGDRSEDFEDVPPYMAVLPLRTEGAELERIAATPTTRPLTQTSIDIDARAGLAFPAPFTAKMVMRGQSVATLRYVQASLDAKDVRTFQDGVITPLIGSGTIADRAVSFDDARGEATLTASGIVDMGWDPKEGRRSYSINTGISSFSVGSERGTEKNATIPVAVQAPNHTVIRKTIRLPRGGTGFSLVGSDKFSGTIAGTEISYQTALTDGVVTLTERQRAMVTEIPANVLAEARATLARAQAKPLTVAAPATYPDAKVEIAEAKKTGALKPLIAVYDKSVAADTTDSTRVYDRATFYESIEEPEKAMADIDRLIKLYPATENYLWRARLRATKSPDGALADIAAARALEPTSLDAVQQLVNLRVTAKKYDAALSDIDAAMADGVSKPKLLAMKAHVLDNAKRFDEALTAMDAAIDLAPGKPELLNERCWLKGTRNRALDTALKDCTRAIDLMDDPAPALDSRGLVYLRMQRYDDAIADFDAALKRDPTLEASLFARGVARLRKGDRAGGDADLKSARAISADIDRVYAEYGVTP